MTLNQRLLRAAVEAFVGDACIQHHPSVGDGREAFIDCLQRMAVAYSGKVTHLKRAIAEGNVVMLRCHQIRPGINTYVGIEVFCFDDHGKVVEHWDALWVFPGTISSDDGPF